MVIMVSRASSLSLLFICTFSFASADSVIREHATKDDDSLPDEIGNKLSYEFNNVFMLDVEQLKTFQESPLVTTLYFYKGEVPQLRNFFKEFDKSGEYLKAYGVKLGVFDCTAHHAEVCGTEKVEQKVHMYRLGASLLELHLQTMFDVNSIMSNILQLVLIRDVPILQTSEEFESFLYANKGSKNVIFTFQKAIGTYEHRIFMEVAYAYHETFQFALTTNKDTWVGHFDDAAVGDSSVAVWYLSCKDLPGKAMPCPKSRYIGKMYLSTLARYVKTLTQPAVFNIPADGSESPYDGLHQLIVYYNNNNAATVEKLVSQLTSLYRGMFGILSINLDESDKVPYPFHGELPAISFKLKHQEEPTFYLEKNWDFKNIAEFLSQELNANEDFVSRSLNRKDVIDDSKLGEFDVPDIASVETQDDMVAEAVFRARRRPMNLELIPKLTDKTFPTVLNTDLLFVLFYLPFDDRSMAFLHAYIEASRKFENDTIRPLAAVNCYDWTDVCGKEHITMYPTVRIYRKGQSLEYEGMLDSEEVVKTVRLMSQPPVTGLNTVQEIKNFMDGNLPSGKLIPTDTMVLGLFDQAHGKELKVFWAVSEKLHGKIIFGANYDGSGAEIAKSHYQSSLPVVVMMRRMDTLQPFTVYKGNFNTEEVEKFVLESRVPVMPELTVHMFPLLYKEKKPFVLAFLNENDESQHVREVMSKIAQISKFKTLRFCWMLAKNDNIGMKVLKEYNKDGIVPAVAYVNLQKGQVDNYMTEINEDEPVIDWLTAIVKGDHSPSVTLPEGDWKPQKEGYDFLAMMDWEEKNPKAIYNEETQADVRVAESQGIGFDEEGNEVDYRDGEGDQKHIDDEIREELLGLQNSRLYRHSSARKSVEGTDGELKEEAKEDNSNNKPSKLVQHEEL